MMWAQALVGSSPTSGTNMAYYRTTTLSNDKNLQAYVIGLAIGDGNLSCVHKTTRLRISCDTKYPKLITQISESLRLLLPQNKVSMVKKKGNCIDVIIYSNHLENLLGWKAEGGPKFRQTVRVPEWIMENKKYKTKCLRGLIETDGCIYNDRGYSMVMFSTIIPELAEDVKKSIVSLGFNPRKYRIPKKSGAPFKYQIRLSKDVQKFLDLVQPDKR